MPKPKPRPEKRKRGAQPGNVNALKHGFYSAALGKAGQKVLRIARTMDPQDLAEEIAILRARLFALLQADPDNINTLMLGCEALARLAAVQFRIKQGGGWDLTITMTAILDDVRLTVSTLNDPTTRYLEDPLWPG